MERYGISEECGAKWERTASGFTIAISKAITSARCPLPQAHAVGGGSDEPKSGEHISRFGLNHRSFGHDR